MNFKDLFSGYSGDYLRFRPSYPEALFAWLANLAPSRACAVDVGCGNGQATVLLAAHMSSVVGVDPSAAQLAQAVPHARVKYHQSPAESTGLPDSSADLLTAAQAFHWFKHQAFFSEARRLLVPRGVLAFWCYGIAQISPEIDATVHHLYEDTLGPYWEPERRLVEDGYRSVAVPFAALEPPFFETVHDWTLQQWTGYLSTWSALHKYQREHGTNPLEDLWPELHAAWGGVERRTIRWPLSVRAFRV